MNTTTETPAPVEGEVIEHDDSLPAEPQAQAIAVQNPVELLALAVQSGTDVDQLEKLMALQERWEAAQAKKAFFKALAKFQATCPAIIKRKKVSYNDVEYHYAPLSDIVEQTKTLLKAAGLSYRFVQKISENSISITCVVSHHDGHSESTTLTAAADKSGSKNSIQGIGSTVTYLQRYTLLGGLGITTADEDIDGRLDPEFITEEQAAALKRRLEATESNVGAFCRTLKIDNVDAMPAVKYAQADKMLTQKEAKMGESNENS